MSQPAMIKESRALLSSLSDQRDHVLGILEGLSEEALRRPVLPSGGRAWGWYAISPSISSGSGSAASSPASKSNPANPTQPSGRLPRTCRSMPFSTCTGRR
jgi:hypothetical protein